MLTEPPTSHALTALSTRKLWQRCVAQVCALAFLLLVSAGLSHQHGKAAPDHDCTLCTAVAGKLATAAGAPPLAAPVAAGSYPLARPVRLPSPGSLQPLAPRNCGPPAATPRFV